MNKNKQAAKLFQDHRNELGFVNTAQVREKSLYVETVSGDVVAAVLCNHCVRKPQTTVYDIAVDEKHRRSGHASSLIEKIADDSPHSKIIAKCPKELDANKFYSQTGWTKIDTEDGKSRELNVWKFECNDD